jgi:hypothetical protein
MPPGLLLPSLVSSSIDKHPAGGLSSENNTNSSNIRAIHHWTLQVLTRLRQDVYWSAAGTDPNTQKTWYSFVNPNRTIENIWRE